MIRKLKRVVYAVLVRIVSLKAVGFMLRVWIRLFPSSPTTVYLLASSSYRAHRRPALSLSILKKLRQPAVAKDPKYVKELAETYFDLNEYQKASKLYQQLLTINGPAVASRVYYKLIKSLRLSSQYKVAYFVSTIASDLFPNDSDILREKARLLKQQQDFTALSKTFSKQSFSSLGDEHAALYVQALIQTKAYKKLHSILSEVDIYSKSYLLLTQALLLTEERSWKEALKLWKYIDIHANDTDYSFRLSETRTAQFNIEVITKLLDTKAYLQSVTEKAKPIKKQPKVAVVTSYTKGYDTLKPHSHVNPAYDYLVFTDDTAAQNYGFYDIRPLPIDEPDGRISTRYAKLQPHKFLSSYDVVVWLDTSIMVVDDIAPYVEEFLTSDKAVASSPHTYRKTALEELITCAELGKDSLENLTAQYEAMQDVDLSKTPLYENGFLMFRMKHMEQAGKALDDWWEHVNKYSKRDQLSFGYVTAKHKVDVHPIVERPHNINDNPALLLMPHNLHFTALEELNKKL